MHCTTLASAAATESRSSTRTTRPILIATQAVCLIGASNAIVNWRFAGDELDYVINDSGARILFVGHELMPSVELIRDKLTVVERIVTVGGDSDELDVWIADTATHRPAAATSIRTTRA